MSGASPAADLAEPLLAVAAASVVVAAALLTGGAGRTRAPNRARRDDDPGAGSVPADDGTDAGRAGGGAARRSRPGGSGLGTGLGTGAGISALTGSGGTVALLVLVAAALGRASGLADRVTGPVVGVVAVASGFLVVVGGLHRRTAARTRLERAGVAAGDACELLVGELGAGVPPTTALARVAETHRSLTPVVGTATLSGEVPTALRDLASSSGVASWARVADAWEVATRSGAGLAPLLAQVAAGERDVAARRRLVRTELADARATARLMAGLPWLLVGAASVGGGGAARFLLTTWPGVLCATAGCTFAAVGLLWMGRIERDGVPG